MIKKILFFSKLDVHSSAGSGPINSISEIIENCQITNYSIAIPKKNYINKKSKLNRKFFTFFNVLRIMSNSDVIIFSSFFSFDSTIIPLILSKFLNKKVIISPRGEFLKGKIKNKKYKKHFYIIMFRIFLNSKKFIFHSTSSDETKSIKYFLNNKITEIPNYGNYELNDSKLKVNNKKIIFFSRISQEKNLEFAISVFNNLNSNLDLDFHIYGPVSDQNYFKLIEKLILKNNRITYKGVIDRNNIDKVISNYDLFLFPTFGENFGHVYVEAIRNQLFTVTSNEVPFNDLSQFNIGVNITEFDIKMYVDAISNYYTDFSLITENFSTYLKIKKYDQQSYNQQYLQLINN